jgi:hypothetical protein
MIISSASSTSTTSIIHSACTTNQSYVVVNEEDKIKTTLARVAKIVSEILPSQAQGGSLTSEIVVDPLTTSGSVACVYSIPDRRMIVWNKPALEATPLPTVIFWTLFEQLNVQKADRFHEIQDQFRFGSISLDQAVEEIEQEEYMNALEAKALMLQAMKNKTIEASEEQFDVVASDFHTHYLLQQLQGHSHRIATRLAPTSSSVYGGSWHIDLDKLSVSERKQIEELILLKNQLSNPSKKGRALLKLGCNLVYLTPSQQEVKPTIIKAIEEIFSSQEMMDAKNQAWEFFQSKAMFAIAR